MQGFLSILLAGSTQYYQPDIVEHDENHMTDPGFDLILGCKSTSD